MSEAHHRTKSHSPTTKSEVVANYSFGDATTEATGRSGSTEVFTEEERKEHQIQDRQGLGKTNSSNVSPVRDHQKCRFENGGTLTDVSKLCARDIFRIMHPKKYNMIDGKLLHDHEGYFSNPDHLALLEGGGHLFSFTCRAPHLIQDYEVEMVDSIINLSSFADEVAENGQPIVNIHDEEDRGKYTYLIQKAAYILPLATVSDMTPKFVSTYAYQSKSQPASSKIWEDSHEENTFRFTKTVVRFVFWLTLQMKVSRIPDSVLQRLSLLMGVKYDSGLLMERTRRDISKSDSTAKVKSVLLYSEVDGGLLCTNFTIALQTHIPNVVSKLMTTFGSMGLSEVGETAANTRNYLKATLQK